MIEELLIKLNRQVARIQKRVGTLRIKYEGKESHYMYYVGYTLGYEEGMLRAKEELIDLLTVPDSMNE